MTHRVFLVAIMMMSIVKIILLIYIKEKVKQLSIHEP